MMLCWIDSDGVSNHDVVELADLRKRTDGFLWIDIPEWSEEAEATLTKEFQFHPLAIAESKTEATFRESMSIRTMCSSLCTHLRSTWPAMCTISSWTSLLGMSSW
jgi:Mg2+ and Co2+ transporter CorA